MFCDPVKFSKDRKRKLSHKKKKKNQKQGHHHGVEYCLEKGHDNFPVCKRLSIIKTGKILTIKFRAHVYVAGNPAIFIFSPLHVLPDFPHFAHSSPCVIVHRSKNRGDLR